MSKIERALEKAAILRGTLKEEPEVTPPFTPPPHIYPESPDTIEVSHPLLVTANNSHTPIAEEYRKLKSVLVELTRKEKFRNMMMVTSSLCSEGKSITALNLAISLAHEHDNTVLLVDADLRKPSLHSYLGIEAKTGLAECMTQEIDVGEAIIRTGIGKLSLLPAGNRVKNPVELFSSQKVRELFLQMKSRYRDRYIIIDTPPVLPFTESRTLSTMMDAVIMVVKEGVASPDEITEAIGYVKGPDLLGIVYNEATIEGRSNHYFHY